MTFGERIFVSSSARERMATHSLDTREGFEAVALPLMPDLLAYFVRRVEPQDESADCLSETMVALWRHRHRLPADESERRAWAFGIARHVLQNHQRGRIRRVALANKLRSDLGVSDSQVVAPDAVAAASALAVLGDRDRELVQLIVWDGFGVAEAGAILGLKAGAARVRYSRAKERLRTELGEGRS